ncbi:MAG: Nif3-like dinuclear metal center hexameric protein [Streptococcus sp.]
MAYKLAVWKGNSEGHGYLDVRENTVAEAIEKVDLIIAKHAPIFRPVKDLVSSPDRDILLDLVKHDIAVILILMLLMMALMIGSDIKDTTYLTQTSENHGIGRVGDIAPQTIEELALKVKQFLAWTVFAWFVMTMIILLLAVWLFVGGSGQVFYKDAEKGCTSLITGDVY